MVEEMTRKIWERPVKSRKPNRLSGYDYSQNGYYFITMCAYGRVEWFGEIKTGEIKLNEFGEVARKMWLEILSHFVNIELDEFVIMPNHIHGIIVIKNGSIPVGNRHACSLQKKRQYQTVPVIIGSYKSAVSRGIRRMENGINFHWQKSFYEHVIRNEISLGRIREYIQNNPVSWDEDIENSENCSECVDYYEKLFFK